jgi:hypothetical protein
MPSKTKVGEEILTSGEISQKSGASTQSLKRTSNDATPYLDNYRLKPIKVGQ